MTAAQERVSLPADTTPIPVAAEMYAELGLSVVPLHGIVDGRCTCESPDCGRSIGKHPVARDWQKRASSDVDTVREAFRGHRGNVGIMMGSRFVVFDVDGDEGYRSIESLGPLPETMTSRSGSGGEHRVFAYAPHQNPGDVTNRRVLPGLDVKTRSGQIVVAPSMHRSGQRYRWTTPVMPAVLPDWLYDRIKKTKYAPVVSLPGTSSGDLCDRAKKYMAKVPPAIEGAGGDTQTFAAARSLAGWVLKGLSQSDAWSLFCDYNRRCDPPWDEARLRRKFDQGLSAESVPQIPDRPRVTNIHGGPVASPDYPIPPDDSDAPPNETPEPTPSTPPTTDWRARMLWETTSRGTSKASKHTENAIVVLRYHPAWAGKVRLDTHAQNVTVCDPPWHESDRPDASDEERPWTDQDSVRLSAWIRREMYIDMSVADCDRAVGVAAESQTYHPVRDWMDSLTWDNTFRLDTWLATYLGTPQSDYAAAVGRWWMIAAVARTYEPGCKADNVLILEGPQGLKKSSALRVLASPRWFSDTPLDLQSKDAYLGLQGRLVVELAELDSLKRADATRAKAFFSSECDVFRPPYGRRTVRVPRGCVFAGSTNQATYLQDRTGNRRFWPVACTLIDLDALVRDREQLWAEAVWHFREGAHWWPDTAAELAVCEGEQAPRAEGDEWEATVKSYLARPRADASVTIGELLSEAVRLPVSDWSRSEQMRIVSILQGIGYVRRREPTGARRWFYVPT